MASPAPKISERILNHFLNSGEAKKIEKIIAGKTSPIATARQAIGDSRERERGCFYPSAPVENRFKKEDRSDLEGIKPSPG